MNRRSFLASMLALGAAPAIVRASSLMPVRQLVLPTIAERMAINQLRAAHAFLRIFSGPEGALGNALLCEIPFEVPFGKSSRASLLDGPASGSEVRFAPAGPGKVIRAGRAERFEVVSGGHWMVRGSVGERGADMTLNNAVLVTGDQVSISTFKIGLS